MTNKQQYVERKKYKKEQIYDDKDENGNYLNTVEVIGAKFTNLTDSQRQLINKYGVSAQLYSGEGHASEDVESATINMDFLGERPLNVIWKKDMNQF